MATDEPAVLLTVEQAAQRLHLSRAMLYQLIHARRLRSITVGRARRVPVRALDEFVARELAAGEPDDAA